MWNQNLFNLIRPPTYTNHGYENYVIVLQLRSQVPKFGNWEIGEDVPYTAYFEKAKKVRNAKTNPKIPDSSSNNEPSFQAPEEAEVKSIGFERDRPKDHVSSTTKHENRVSHEEVDLRNSTGSPTFPKRTSRYSVGSDRSFDNSPMHPQHQRRGGNYRGSVSSESSYSTAPSSTPGRLRTRQVIRGDENLDDGSPAIPKFGDWDDNNPASGERYTEVFNKAREDKQSGGGKSPMITTENTEFYGQPPKSTKGCSCFPWS